MYSVVVGCPRLVVYDKGSHVSTRYLEPLEDFFLECWPMTRPSQVIEVFYHACALLVGSWVMVDQSPYSVRGDFWRYVCPYRLSFVSLSRLELRWSCCYESGFMSTFRDWPRKGFVIALFLPAFPGRSARGCDTDYGVVESVRKAILQVKDNKVIVVNEPHPFMNMNWNVNFSLLCKLFFSPWGSCSKMSDNAHRARLVTRERVILYGDLSRVVPRLVGDTTVRCYLWCLMREDALVLAVERGATLRASCHDFVFSWSWFPDCPHASLGSSCQFNEVCTLNCLFLFILTWSK